MPEQPPDILEIGVGELAAILGGLTGIAVFVALAENLREWTVAGLNPPPGLGGYLLELAITTGAAVIGGLWGALIALAATVAISRLFAWYYRRHSPGGEHHV